MTSTSKSVVLGVVTGLPVEAVEGWALSLRATGYKGTSHLFVGQTSPDVVARLREIVDTVTVIDERFPDVSRRITRMLRYAKTQRGIRRFYPTLYRSIMRALSSQQRSARGYEYAVEGLQSLRYEVYRDFLRTSGADADFVFLSDVRDVWFQADPFSPEPAELEVFLENDNVLLGQEPFNRRWVSDLYGAETLRHIGSFTVTCSGTVAGQREGLLRYLDHMVSALSDRRQALGSHDQGAHNYLLRTGRLDPVTIVSNGEGRVLTLGKASVPLREAGTWRNLDGSVPSVLHQYDRHPQLVREIVATLDQLRAA